MIIQICYYIIYLISAFIFCQYCNNLFKPRKNTHFQLICLLILYSFSFSMSFWGTPIISIITFTYCNFAFITFCYDCPFPFTLFHSAFATAVMTSCDHSLIVVLSFFNQEILEKSLHFKNFVAFSIVSKLTFYLILHFISIHPRIGKYKDQSKDNIALIVYIIPSASFFITTTLCVVSIYSDAPSIANIMISISAIMMMTICITTSWFYSHMLDKNQELLDLKIRAQREYDSAKYYKMLIHQDEQQRILIHDIKKHYYSLLDLLRSEKYKDAEVYINNIIASKTLNRTLRKCDNDLLNALLYRYSQICSDNDIDFHVDIRKGLINFLQFNEMTILFSNLMENAIEAAVKCESRFVELYISEKKALTLLLSAP